MVLEIADFTVAPGQQAAFTEAVQRGVESVLSQAAGFLSWRLVSGVESPQRIVLMIEWATLEDHTVGFRGGPLFPAWRAIVGPFFARPPVVEHFEPVAAGR